LGTPELAPALISGATPLVDSYRSFTSHPLAFLVVGVYVALWLIFDPESFNWQGIATVATW